MTQTESAQKNGSGGGMNVSLIAFLCGAAIGATAGLMYAPKPGRETRTMIRDQYQDWRERAGDVATTAREKANEFATVAREKFSRGENNEKDIQGA